MSFYKDPENKLHFIDSQEFEYLLPVGSVSITDEEAEEIRIENEPVPDPVIVVKQEILETSQNALKSGVLNVLLYGTMTQYLTAVRANPAASGLTDEQIDALLTNPVSQYYNDTYTKTKAYYDQLKSLTDQLP
jgi:hypothetical protein